MKKGTTTAATGLRLLTLCWAAATLGAQQNTGCGFLTTQYALDNLRNLSVGMSNDMLRKSALPPLLAQPRVSGTAGNALARDFIKRWMSKAGWTVEEDPFLGSTPYGPLPFSSVVATLNPGRPRRVVLACHYDSKLMPGGLLFRPFVGATDSAVPCALLMDSALQLRQVFRDEAAGNSSRASGPTLQFIFFDGEEAFGQWSHSDSLYGARHLAEKWANMADPGSPGLSYLQTIEVLILLDLIGTADTHFQNRFMQTAGVYDKLRNIEMCLMGNGYLEATANPLPLFTPTHAYSPIEDDHLPFLQRGVPVVHLITSPFPVVWHSPLDNEHALDFQRIDNLARILRLFLVDLLL